LYTNYWCQDQESSQGHTDTISVSWGWFQFLLLLTFPLHLLAMNAMLGGLAIGIIQHFKGGTVQKNSLTE
jgi:hypothetical protein